MCCRKGFSLDR
ncbi:hypothetical protein F383_26349 [Gossypium arboreum]|uniref:Uncharacterized protein n=1 Tax=Gossypium arboreum TaxID=29729 RepID=A0A0B0NUY0_GOSAR|nr:hypothetical protein F383_10642 [Gossypium arboreum]KHG20298.1 hypothetical protein F383_26349 [Gossypium arboreum]